MSNPRVNLDVTIDDEKADGIKLDFAKACKRWRIVVELVKNRHAEKFRSLCSGEIIGRSGNPLSYKGSSFDRVIPGFMCQGGHLADWEPSFQGEDYLAGENHLNNSQYTTGPGLVVMSKNNGSQFFICTGKTDWLDLKKHVVVGRVVKGMDVVRAIEKLGSSSGKTKKRVVIADCGQL